MTSTMQRELQELRAAAESHGARHVHLEHFAYPPGTRMAVNLTVDFRRHAVATCQSTSRLCSSPKASLAGRVGIWRLLELFDVTRRARHHLYARAHL